MDVCLVDLSFARPLVSIDVRALSSDLSSASWSSKRFPTLCRSNVEQVKTIRYLYSILSITPSFICLFVDTQIIGDGFIFEVKPSSLPRPTPFVVRHLPIHLVTTSSIIFIINLPHSSLYGKARSVNSTANSNNIHIPETPVR